MMRRIYIYILMVLGICSCTSDLDELRVQGKDCISITVYNTSMGTKADDTVEDGFPVKDNAGTDRERLLTRLDIFLYPKGKTGEECVFHKHISGLNNTSGKEVVPVYVNEDIAAKLFQSGATQCDVYVVANMPDNVTFTGKEKVADIQAMTIKSDEFKGVVASDGSFVAPEKFIMSSYDSAQSTEVCKVTKAGDAITGTVPLKRAASKITMTVLVPEYIDVDAFNASENIHTNEKWRPYFIDADDPTKGVHTMHMGFHKGLLQTVVDGQNNIVTPSDGDDKADPIRFETLYTEKFKWIGTISVDKDKDGNPLKDKDGNPLTKNYYKYSCEVSFYSYPFSWKGSDNDVEAPYFTLMLPWRRDGDERFTTYYYQVVVNGLSQEMDRNYWYDINLNIGVLGSRDYNIPAELDDMTCYILDWSDGDAGLKEDVNINEWRYLVVPQTYIEMNNTDTGYLPFEASHKVAWTLEWPGSADGLDAVEKYNQNNKYSAYYINCRSKTPVSVSLSGVNNSSFQISESGDEIVLTNAIPSDVYSPIYYHLKIWLDLTPNGVLDADEQSFVERVVFVQYPPIYIVPDQSTPHSIFVNNINSRNGSYGSSNDLRYGNYNLGRMPGTSDSGDHMYVINVSSFKETDKFTYYDNDYQYLIGDPRVTDSDTDLNDDGYDMDQHWASVPDVNGVTRKLQNYYPTAKQGDVFRVIAPKLRVVSFMSSGYSYITPEGAAMRCASFQEDGFPAGRWRLPTFAEIRFIIFLQQQEVIQDIFYGGNYYYASTDQVRNQSTIDVRTIEWDNNNFQGSVRCVYDEWYWGSEREARPDNSFDGGYAFTWGDAPR